MPETDIKLSGFKAFHCWLAEKSLQPFIKNVIIPSFYTLPCMIVSCIVLGRVNDEVELNQLLSKIKPLTELEHPKIIILALIMIYGFLWEFMIACIRDYAPQKDALSKDIMRSVIASINGIVIEKTKRMNNFERKTKAHQSLSGENVFLSIIQPEEQIFLFASAIESIFKVMDSKTYFRICIYKIKDNKPTDIVAWSPFQDRPKASFEKLSAPQSKMTKAIKDRKTIIIEDIHTELKKHAEPNIKHPTGNDAGSQLFFPILDQYNERVVYILSIHGDRKKSLVLFKLKLYKWIIGHIVLRMALEDSLLTLKEKVENGSNKDTGKK